MKTEAIKRLDESFEEYYVGRDCSFHRMFIVKDIIEAIYKRGYADGFGDSIKSFNDESGTD